MEDLFSGPQVVEGTWQTIRVGHRLVSLEGSRVLDWEPATGRYRIWRYDRGVTQGDPLPDLVVKGTWSTIRSGHKLRYLGGNRVLDWEPATGRYRVWRYDRGVTQGDPLPDLVGQGTSPTMRSGHQLVYLGQDQVLHWELETAHYRIWRYDRGVTQGDPLTRLLSSGDWATIDGWHELTPLGRERILDRERLTGHYRLWRWDPSARGRDPLAELLAEGDLATIRGGHELVYLGRDRLLDWEPETGRYRIWPLRATYYVDGAYDGLQYGTRSQPYRTVGAALDGAVAGDTVLVAPGVYRENVRLKRGVAVRCKQVGAAILHGGADLSGGWPTVTGAEEAELRGFAITGGGDGILLDGTSPVIKRNVVRGNYGDAGIVCLNGSRALIENNTVLGNLGQTGSRGGIGIYVEDASPTLRYNIITGNRIGYAASGGSPNEEHNVVWQNHQDWASGTQPGSGSTAQDPKFVDPEVDDWRLEPATPCPYHGAFEGDGGHAVPLPVQEYFVEAVLGAGETEEGLQTNGLSRFTADPVFWFPPDQRGQSERDIRPLLSAAIRELSQGRYQARFRDDAQPPADRSSVVKVDIAGEARGSFYHQGLVPPLSPSQWGQRAALIERGAPITGGRVGVQTDLDGLGQRKVWTLRHELGHALSLQHSFRGEHVMGQGGSARDYSPVERAACALLFRLPTGTTLAQLIAQGSITRAALAPFPRIDRIYHWAGQEWEYEWDWQTRIFVACPGEYVLLQGSRLTLRFQTECRWQGRPADYAPPTVYFGDIAVMADPSKEYQVQRHPANDRAGAPARNLKVRVPSGAKSGWVFVRARRLESNPVYLELR